MNDVTSFLDPPADHGDWRAEYGALVESCAITGRPDRAAVSVTGDRRVEMLDGLLTNRLADMAGSGRHAFLLTAKGGVLTDLRVLPRSEDLLLDIPFAGLQNLLAAFRKYLPPIYAGFEDVSAEVRQIGLYGPEAVGAAREALGAEVPEQDLGVSRIEFEGDALTAVRNRWLAGDGLEFIGRPAALESLGARLLPAVSERGGRRAGMRALELVHVEWGVPRYGIDIQETNLAQETGLEERAISYDKGCYLGQEVVARVHFRGHVNRLLRGLRFGDTVAPPGSALEAGGREVGAVTTAVISPALGPIGMGYVRREIEPSNVLCWRDGERRGPATVAELPFRSGSV